jgi:Fe-S-cluster-containing hydrogenase component 2
MSRIFKQKNNFVQPKILREGIIPKEICYAPGIPAEIVFSDNKKAHATCLHCSDAPCLNFSEKDLENSAFPEFPQDGSTNVCATNAMTWDKENGVPVIDESRCINCGVCAIRCPVGAIFMTEQGAKVHNDENNFFVSVEGNEQIDNQIFNQSIVKFDNIKRTGKLLNETDEIMKKIYDKITLLRTEAQFPNILTRNLLLALDLRCSIRRRGDVNIRMDAVLGPPGTKYGVVEIEFDQNALLDSPRNILDDIAVLSSRYQIKPTEITPLIVSLVLPNSRSEYWRVIKDINNVLKIKINSITIGALLLFVWNLKKINFEYINFYADIDNMEIRNSIESYLKRKLNISSESYPILEVEK